MNSFYIIEEGEDPHLDMSDEDMMVALDEIRMQDESSFYFTLESFADIMESPNRYSALRYLMINREDVFNLLEGYFGE